MHEYWVPHAYNLYHDTVTTNNYLRNKISRSNKMSHAQLAILAYSYAADTCIKFFSSCKTGHVEN